MPEHIGKVNDPVHGRTTYNWPFISVLFGVAVFWFLMGMIALWIIRVI